MSVRCLDSTFLIDLLKGDEAAAAKMREIEALGEGVSLPAPCLAEVLLGAHFKGGGLLRDTLDVVARLDVLEIDAAVAGEAGPRVGRGGGGGGVGLGSQQQPHRPPAERLDLGCQFHGGSCVVGGYACTAVGQEAAQGDTAARQAEHRHRPISEGLEIEAVERDRRRSFGHGTHGPGTKVEKKKVTPSIAARVRWGSGTRPSSAPSASSPPGQLQNNPRLFYIDNF